MSKPKFNIGDEVFYVRSSCHYGLNTPCTMCFGKRKVAVVLGNGENVDSECEYCRHGIDPPSGQSKTWEPKSEIKFGTISGVNTTNVGWNYTIGYESGLESHEMFTSREEAVPLMEQRLAEEKERRALWERDHFRTATKKQIWSAGYHRGQIADHERSIAWHKMRLCMVNDKK